VGVADKRYFQGLPSPAAAACLAGWVWLGSIENYNPTLTSNVGFVLTLCCGLLMFSNMRYHSFKEFDLKGKVPFVVMLVIVLVLALIANNPPWVLFFAFLTYALSGPVMTLIKLRKHRSERSQTE